MENKYLFMGGNGLIGSYIVAHYLRLVDSRRILSPSHKKFDITDSSAVSHYFKLHKPSIVINLAAHRNASTAELQRGDKEGSVWKANVIGAKNIAKACKTYGSYLIHISTDYVFSGHKDNPGPYSEKDTPEKNDNLLSWYGITKREGESAILNTLSNAAIIRINNVTRPNNRDLKLDYIGKFLWLYEQEKLYPIFGDQYVTLTYIPSITQIITKLIKTKKTGIYHAASIDVCTPFELAYYAI
ncbi:MAG: sugar nucleotide-binding protein, partial [Patescibacteria group bacterium]